MQNREQNVERETGDRNGAARRVDGFPVAAVDGEHRLLAGSWHEVDLAPGADRPGGLEARVFDDLGADAASGGRSASVQRPSFSMRTGTGS